MQGSPRGVSVSVKILFSRFNASHGLVLVSAHSNLFIPIFQCDLGGIFGLGGLDFLVGSSNLWVCFGGYIYFCLRLESAYH